LILNWQARESVRELHRIQCHMASNDPDFERKAADIIGLYLNPPQHAAVFSVNEKTGDPGAVSTSPTVATLAGAGGTAVRSNRSEHLLRIAQFRSINAGSHAGLKQQPRTAQ
jgi:hypothetical protein